MSNGTRTASSALAVLALGVGAMVAIGVSKGNRAPSTADATRPASTPVATSAPTSRAADPIMVEAPSTPTVPVTTPSRSSASATPSGTPSTRATSHPATTSAAPARTTAPKPKPHSVTHPVSTPSTVPVVHKTTAPKPKPKPKGRALPLSFSTGSATRVLTVTAPSTSSTRVTVQAWQKAAGGGWTKVGSAISGYDGSQGMTTHPSESLSATPIGSYTLTQAFGAYGNPGTGLTYHRTNSRYYWMSTTKGSQARLYNTMQVCPASDSGCYDNGTNERLYYETPSYNYAVVIDYNTRNAPGGVHQRKGSAFFLHVSTGEPTAGCVSIPQSRLVSIMRWLTPSAHPRILIGTT